MDGLIVNNVVKGVPVRVFAAQGLAMLSDIVVDCRAYNAASVQVEPAGTTPSAVVSVEGAPAGGGDYLPLTDPQASQTITAGKIFDVIVGASWVRIRLAGVTGNFTVTVTPYLSPGPSAIVGTVT